MSTALAIAAVTAVLRDLLLTGVVDHQDPSLGPVTVTALPPDRVPTSGTGAKSQLNLFLYQVTPNQGWRNHGLPARDAAGERRANPPLALDLHYLLSAYGVKDLHAELLLGFAMQALHETPVLTRDAIRTALDPALPVDGDFPPFLSTLGTSGLADQVEQIKITPASLPHEELSRLWAAFQTHYRPSVAYQASTVLIESGRPVRQALPVRARNVVAVPARAPVIESVLPQQAAAGGTLALLGRDLAAAHVEVLFGGVPAPAASVRATPRQVVVSPLPAGLRAGVQSVRVAHGLLFGTPADPHRGPESNVAAFVLAPTLLPPPAPPRRVAHGGTLALRVDPPVHALQRVRVLLGERALEAASPRAGEPPSDAVSVAVPDDVLVGTYPLRVEVDGARSLLEPDPATGEYATPAVEVT